MVRQQVHVWEVPRNFKKLFRKLLMKTCTIEDLMELEAQRKDKERQQEEELTEEPKRFMRKW